MCAATVHDESSWPPLSVNRRPLLTCRRRLKTPTPRGTNSLGARIRCHARPEAGSRAANNCRIPFIQDQMPRSVVDRGQLLPTHCPKRPTIAGRMPSGRRRSAVRAPLTTGIRHAPSRLQVVVAALPSLPALAHGEPTDPSTSLPIAPFSSVSARRHQRQGDCRQRSGLTTPTRRDLA